MNRRVGSTWRRCRRCGRKPDEQSGRKRCGSAGTDGSACGGEIAWAYQIDVAPPGDDRDRRSASGYATKAKAIDAMHLAKLEAEDSLQPDSRRSESVGQFLNSWLAESHHRIGRDLKSSTWRAYRLHIERHLVPRFQGTIADLAQDQIVAVYRDLEKTGNLRSGGRLSPKTVWNIHLTLHRALEDAVEQKLIDRNPADGAYSAPEAPTDIRSWDAEELKTFLRATANERLAALWRLAATTGMRRGEILGLRWTDVDLARGMLSVVQARVRGEEGVETSSPKTPRGRRSIDLDSGTVSCLRSHRKQQMAERLEAGPAWIESELVFTRSDGGLLDPDVVSQMFNKIVRATGLRHIRFHDLRHTMVSLLLKSGEPSYVVSRRVGHASEAFTEKQYAHVLPGQQRDAAERFAELIDTDSLPSVRHQDPA